MILGRITIGPPLDERKTVALNTMLTTLFDKGLQARSGTYTGTGVDGRTVDLGIKAQLVYVQKVKASAGAATPSGTAAIALREADGVTYVLGSGYATDAVKSFVAEEMTLGTNASVNASGQLYRYFAIG